MSRSKQRNNEIGGTGCKPALKFDRWSILDAGLHHAPGGRMKALLGRFPPLTSPGAFGLGSGATSACWKWRCRPCKRLEPAGQMASVAKLGYKPGMTTAHVICRALLGGHSRWAALARVCIAAAGGVGQSLAVGAAETAGTTASNALHATALLPPAERRALLDAIRPQAAQRAGQPVKFLVERLNVDSDWALLTGTLVSTTGGPLAWEKARECHPELDKLLWVVAARQNGVWQVKHLEICATEPPHWMLERFGGFAWPCGLYVGLEGPTGEDLAAGCRRERAAPPAAKR